MSTVNSCVNFIAIRSKKLSEMRVTKTAKELGNKEVTEIKEIKEVRTQEDDAKESERVQLFGSGFGATINLISTAIGGGGMFGNIFGASQLGIFGFVFITLLSSIFTYLSVEFLVIASSLSNKTSCYQLSEKYLGGKKGNLLTKIFIIFGNWTFVINTIQIFADFISNSLPLWFNVNDDSFWVSREFAVILGLLFIFPWVQSKTIKSLERLSGAFILLCIIILLIIIVNAFKASLLNDVAPSIQLGPVGYEAFFRGLPAITWCWTIQFNVLPIYNTLDMVDNKTRTMSQVTYWSVISLFSYYVIFGFAALIIWGNRINPDFMTNLDYNDSNYVFYYGMELSTTTQCIMCIVTFASIPIFAFEARTNSHHIIMDIYYKHINKQNVVKTDRECIDYGNIEVEDDEELNIDHEQTPLMGSEHNSLLTTTERVNGAKGNNTDIIGESRLSQIDYSENWLSRLIESGIIITTAAIVALYLTNLNWCLSLVGATYGTYIAYFVPSIVYYRAVSNKKNLSTKNTVLKYLAIISILYGIIVCVLGLIMAFL